MGEAHIQEAPAASQTVVGFSSYLAGIEYSVEQLHEELQTAVEDIKQEHSG